MLFTTRIILASVFLVVLGHFSRSSPLEKPPRKDDIDSFWKNQLLTPECQGEDCITKAETQRTFSRFPCPSGPDCTQTLETQGKRNPCLRKRCQESQQTKRMTKECQQDEECNNKRIGKINRSDKEQETLECPSGENCERNLGFDKGKSEIHFTKGKQDQVLQRRTISLRRKKKGRKGGMRERYGKKMGFQSSDQLSGCPPGLWCKRQSGKSEDQFKCPPGLWCKRGLSKRKAKKMGFESSDQLSGCPPGLWCKRQIQSDQSEDQFKCPPGLWCKRGLHQREAREMGFESSDQLSGCPPGLWCKRQIQSDQSEDQFKCPPGLWCKRGLHQREAREMGFESSDQLSGCPPGLWCKRQSDQSEDQFKCPPGLWCKRGLDKREAMDMGFQSSDQLSGCPPGLWCKRQSSKSEKFKCPPGLWCKREYLNQATPPKLE